MILTITVFQLIMINMQTFSFEKVQKKLNRKSVKEVEEEKRRENLLQFQEAPKVDPKMEAICQDAIEFYDNARRNNRYYSYHMDNTKKPKPDSVALRIGDIERLSCFPIPYREEPKKKEEKQELS